MAPRRCSFSSGSSSWSKIRGRCCSTKNRGSTGFYEVLLGSGFFRFFRFVGFFGFVGFVGFFGCLGFFRLFGFLRLLAFGRARSFLGGFRGLVLLLRFFA